MSPGPQIQSSDDLKGTILITGANGSLGFWFVQNLLHKYPTYFAVLAVRDDSDKDANTTKLRKMASSIKDANFSIEKVDLASLSSVRTFADSIIQRVSSGNLPPISAIVCNAFNWSLVGQQRSIDDNELSFQVTYLSHFLLVLKLLGSVNKRSGRIIFLGSEAHDGNDLNSFRPLGATIPDNMEELVKPAPDKPGDEHARGFQRYGNAKLATVMFMHMLNRKLLQDPLLKDITALAMDPAGMPGSRAFDNVPFIFKTTMFIVGHFVFPIVKYFTQTLNTPTNAGKELVTMTMGPEGTAGYFLRLQRKESSAESRDEGKQGQLWLVCEKWVELDPSETVLK